MKAISEEHETINEASVVSFLNKVKSDYPTARKIHLILDQSGYNTSNELSLYVQENFFELHFLHPYSPNLNAIE